MRRLVAAWITLAVCGVSAADDVGSGSDRVYTAGERVDLRADSLERDSRRGVVVARGNVVIVQGRKELRADFLAYSETTRRGVASGNVVFTDGEDTLSARFTEFDLDTLEGVAFDAEFVNAGTLELRGSEIRKTGDRTYSFKDGEFTSCRCPDPEDREPWQLEADSAELELKGYGTARNSTLEILGVPVLWLPWMIYPLRTERQTGILFPRFTVSGRNGFEVGLPVFFALGDPVNLTVTPRWLQKRGVGGDAELDYVVGERSGGDMFGAFILDRKVTAGTRKTPFDKERWVTYGDHDFFLPGGVRVRADYTFVSDNSYPNDFNDLRRARRDRFLFSTGWADRAFGGAGAYGLVGAARFADDLQNPDDTDRDDFLLQRLPEIDAQALPASLPFALPFADWFAPALDFQYVYFRQNDRPKAAGAGGGQVVDTNGRFLDTGVDGVVNADEQGRTVADGQTADPNNDNFRSLPGGSFAGTEGDGRFQEGELLADDGHRVSLHPRLGAPVRLFDAVEFYPEVGWHETLYGSAIQGFERRGFLTGRADLRTRLRGRFGSLRHLIEPRLGWALVTGTSQRGNPLYVPATAVPQRRVRQLDLDNVTRDMADRVEKFNGLTFAVGNRFFRREPGAQVSTLLADFVLSGLYDFAQNEFGNVFAEGRLYPFRSATLRFSAGLDPRKGQLTEGLLGLGWRHERGHSFSLDYRFLRDTPVVFEAFPDENRRFSQFRGEFDKINQLAGGLRVAITRSWGVTLAGAYSFERSLLLGNQAGIEYISKCKCWAARLQLGWSRARGVTFGLRYAFIGIGDDSRAPFQSGVREVPMGFLNGLAQGRGF